MHPIALGNRNGSFLSPSSFFSFFFPSPLRCVVRVSRWSMNVSLASYRETFYSLMFRYLFIVLFFLVRKNCVWIKRGKIVASFRMNSLLFQKRKKKERKEKKTSRSQFCFDSKRWRTFAPIPRREDLGTRCERGTTLAALRTE